MSSERKRKNDRGNIFSNASYWSGDDSFGDVVLWHPCLVCRGRKEVKRWATEEIENR